MKEIALHPRTSLIDASGIRKVFDLAANMKNPINLSIGQPHFDTPDAVKSAAINAIQGGRNAYTVTQGTAKLRETLRDYLSGTRGASYGMDELLVTSGVSGGLLLAFMCLFGPGDEVIIPDPYFVMYKHLARILGAEPVYVDTYPDFLLTAERVERRITKRTKAIICASPSNPTGAVLPESEWRNLVSLAESRGLLIISDEIYDQFVYDMPHFSPAGLYKNTLLLGGWSKSYAMTGWRMGYAAGPANIIGAMTTLQQFTFVCAPSMAQEASIVALATPTDARRTEYKKKRDRMIEALSPRYRIRSADGAFYLFIEAPGAPAPHGSGTEFCARAIREKELLIIPGAVFSERDTHFRLSYAAPDETLERGITALLELA